MYKVSYTCDICEIEIDGFRVHGYAILFNTINQIAKGQFQISLLPHDASEARRSHICTRCAGQICGEIHRVMRDGT